MESVFIRLMDLQVWMASSESVYLSLVFICFEVFTHVVLYGIWPVWTFGIPHHDGHNASVLFLGLLER